MGCGKRSLTESRAGARLWGLELKLDDCWAGSILTFQRLACPAPCLAHPHLATSGTGGAQASEGGTTLGVFLDSWQGRDLDGSQGLRKKEVSKFDFLPRDFSPARH